MGLDIRIPMGLMFTIIGAILTIFGVAAPGRSQALGLNVNLIWGAAILVFGAGLLVASRRSPAK